MSYFIFYWIVMCNVLLSLTPPPLGQFLIGKVSGINLATKKNFAGEGGIGHSMTGSSCGLACKRADVQL